MEELFGTSRTVNAGYEALVQWPRFSESNKTCEPLATLYRDAPTYIIKTLTSLQPPLTTRKEIIRCPDIYIRYGAGARLSPPTDGNVVH